MHEKLHNPKLRSRLRVLGQALGAQLAGIDVHAGTRLEHVHRHQADHQADHREAEKQQHGFAEQAAERAFVAHPGDAGDDGAEHHGSNHHFDELDERITQWFERDGLLSPEMPNHDAQHHGAENLEVERFNNFHGITHF